MAIDARMSEREYTKFTESASVPEEVVVKVANADGSNVASTVEIGPGDIEIGAVEIKDHDSETRANVGADGLHVDVQNASIPVTGTFWQGTQPVSGTFYQATQPVSGTFWQATQPVSGTFYQAEQPVIHNRRSDAIQATITSADATSATAVVAKVAAENIYVTDIVISVDTAMSVQLQDDAGPAVLMEQIYLPANSVWSKTFSTPLLVATNQDLDVLASIAGNISVTVTGYQV